MVEDGEIEVPWLIAFLIWWPQAGADGTLFAGTGKYLKSAFLDHSGLHTEFFK